MASKENLQFVPPPLKNLLKYPIQDDINIDEGLSKPEDENLFLISSIAFLQKHLMKKIETDENEKNGVIRKYSDLLIVESGHKHKRQKRYIRLANIEKFDEVLKNEACLPQNVLSNNQLLPIAKKSKSPKLIMSNIFKAKVTNSIPSTISTKKSSTFFNLFKKNSNTSSSLVPINNFVEVDTEKIVVTTGGESNNTGITVIHSTSTISIEKVMNEYIDSDSTFDYRPRPKSLRLLNKQEEEILRIIPKESNLTIKKSINAKLRTSKKPFTTTDDEDSIYTSEVSLVKKEDDYYEDPETGITFKCMPASSLPTRRLKEQQSKLSVCIEEEMESDIDYGQDQRKYPFNITDDVKALVSSEAIDLIINEVWPKIDNDG